VSSNLAVVSLIDRLRQDPECEWIEYKVGNSNPNLIGEYLSAMSNGARLWDEPFGFVIWGIEDKTREVVGTSFKPRETKGKGNEDLVPWLERALRPNTWFEFLEGEMETKRVVVLRVAAAARLPVAFQGDRWIRIGSHKKPLQKHPEAEKRLWERLNELSYETQPSSKNGLSQEAVLALLDVEAACQLLDVPIPQAPVSKFKFLHEELGLVSQRGDGLYEILNHGAILLARELTDFPSIERKALRVIKYRGSGSTLSEWERKGNHGYAVDFEELVQFINSQLPSTETLDGPIRRDTPEYPPLAIRELVANALIHQDLTINGAGPMVEIFDNRVEITNPGPPIGNVDRLLNELPQSRNEKLAAAMRQFGICEERGTGVDKVVHETERFHLPAPLFERSDVSTSVTLFSQSADNTTSRESRVRAVYLHACLRHSAKEQLTNKSVRERFEIAEHNSAQASRYIKWAREAGLIALHDEAASPRNRSYVPYWVKEM